MDRDVWRQVAETSGIALVLGLALFELSWVLEGPAALEVLGLVVAIVASVNVLGVILHRFGR